jgi:hypothetical protein
MVNGGPLSRVQLASLIVHLFYPFSGYGRCRAGDRDAGAVLLRSRIPEMRLTAALCDDCWSTG